MSSSFAFALARDPHTADGGCLTQPAEVLAKIAVNRARLNSETMVDIDYLIFDAVEKATDAFHAKNGAEPDEQQTLAIEDAAARKAISDAVLYLEDDPSDAGIVHIDEKRFYITGGMSGGGAPTDAYDHISLLDFLGIFEEPVTDEEIAAATV